MSVFGSYAQYYDLLYQDKDYQKESQFIIQILKQYSPEAQTILELGCGTGRHAEYLLQEGYQVTGVERSPEMLSICRQRHEQLSVDQQRNMKIIEGDLRTLELNQKFDVVLALFHVISYQTTNNDLQSAFATVCKHLKPGGVFLFDVWYGPAVLSNRPIPRIKRLENPKIQIIRFADPILHPTTNLVDVKYHIYVKNKENNSFEDLEETHIMRYLFDPEIKLFLNNSNLIVSETKEWITKQDPSVSTWGIYYLSQYKP